jgi:hypothetical protein
MARLLLFAAAIIAILLLLAFLVGKLFESRAVRRRIMIATVVTCLIGAIGFFCY